jgi:sugar lactone lactonase YvrE
MKQLLRMTIVVAAVLVSLASAHAASALGLEVVATFDPNAGELPESITIDDAGNLYFSMSNTVRKRTPDGQTSVFGTIAPNIFALGVKVGPDGCVYTASTSLNPSIDGAFVWKICSPSSVAIFAALDQGGHPNDLAFDDDGNLYVTDPLLGVVWKVLPNGSASIWLSDPLLQANFADPVLVILPVGVDGIAFDKKKKNLYLSNLDFGRIVRVPVHDGTAGQATVFASDPLLEGADGIAFDNAGNLFVAVNAHDRLTVLDHQGRVTVLAEGGVLDAPSSMVFGTVAHDQRTLYITSSAFNRAFGIQPGTPHPALLKAEVQHKGLALP